MCTPVGKKRITRGVHGRMAYLLKLPPGELHEHEGLLGAPTVWCQRHRKRRQKVNNSFPSPTAALIRPHEPAGEMSNLRTQFAKETDREREREICIYL